MLVGNSFLSNENNKFNVEGASILGQYRFYSNDQMKKHFITDDNPILQALLKNNIVDKLIEVLKVYFNELNILVNSF